MCKCNIHFCQPVRVGMSAGRARIRHSRESDNIVIPAIAGIHWPLTVAKWIPAIAGMTTL